MPAPPKAARSARAADARRISSASARSTRSRRARADAGANGDRLGAARPARHLGADRRPHRRAARGQRRGGEAARFLGRGACRDRPPRHRRRRRSVACLSRSSAAGTSSERRRRADRRARPRTAPGRRLVPRDLARRRGPRQRAAATAILFLLEEGRSSHWHKVDATELWLFHAGSPLRLRTAPGDDGPVTETRLGADIVAGEQPQLRIRPAPGRRPRPIAAGPWCPASSRPASNFPASRWRRRAGRRGRFDSLPTPVL